MVVLQYTGKEAVEIAKSALQNKFDEQIADAKKTILSISRIYKKDLTAAYQKFINSGCHKGTSIIYFAALYLLLKEEEANKGNVLLQVNLLRGEQEKYINNLEALNKSKEDENTKRTLRQHFNTKRDELQQQIDEHIKSFEVVAPTLVIHQGRLFDNDTKND